MADDLDIISRRIIYKRSVVVSVIVRSQPGGTVVLAARLNGRLVKGINGGAVYLCQYRSKSGPGNANPAQ